MQKSLQTTKNISTKPKISQLIPKFALPNLSALKMDFSIFILSKIDYLKDGEFDVTQKSINKIWIILSKLNQICFV